MNLSIDIDDQHDGSINVNLSGEIDIYTAPKLKEALIPIASRQEMLIEIDLEHVNYMDSTGLGVFISVLKAANESGSSFKLLNPVDRVHRLFTITGLNEIIDIQTKIRGVNES